MKEVSVTRVMMVAAVILGWATAAIGADTPKETKDFADSVASPPSLKFSQANSLRSMQKHLSLKLSRTK